MHVTYFSNVDVILTFNLYPFVSPGFTTTAGLTPAQSVTLSSTPMNPPLDPSTTSTDSTATYQAVPPPVTGYYNQYTQSYSQFKTPVNQDQNQTPTQTQSKTTNPQAPLVGPDYGYGYQGPGMGMGGPPNFNYAGEIERFECGVVIYFKPQLSETLVFLNSIQWTTWYSNVRATWNNKSEL